ALMRSPKSEHEHMAVLSLFALWTVYHRNYDAVICLVPASLMVRYLVYGTNKRLALFWLAAMILLVFDPPGLLVDRLGLDPEALARNVAGWVGLNLNRFLIFAMFWSLIALLWKRERRGEGRRGEWAKRGRGDAERRDAETFEL